MDKKELFEILTGKANSDVYQAFQNLEKQVIESNNMYMYMDDLVQLLEEKTYTRFRAFKLICELSRYDVDGKINQNIDILLSVFDDHRGTVVRQSIKVVPMLIKNKPELKDFIVNKLNHLDLTKYKDTLQPLIEKDKKKF